MFISLFLSFSVVFAQPQQEPPEERSPLDMTRALGISFLQESGLEEEFNKSAIRGMLQYLDEQIGFGTSQLMSVQQKDAVLQYQNGIREGYGLRVQLIERKGFLIEHVFEDGAAYTSGLRKGDLIISIGAQSLMAKRSKEMVDILNQPPKDQIRFEVLREGHLVSFGVSRGAYFLQPISVYENVVQIHYFGPKTAEMLAEILRQKKDEPLILDLRNNDGGSIEEVQKVMGLFATNVVMGYRHFVDGSQEEIRSVSAYKDVCETPIYILTNNQTTQAAELFVAAMQFHQRALVVGEKTAGISSENHFYPLNELLFLYVADVQLWSPGKLPWEGVGLEPSIVVRSSQSIASGKSIDVQLETVLRLIKTP